MKLRKYILIVGGFVVLIALLFINLQLRSNILIQNEEISIIDKIKFDSLVLKEYKRNFAQLDSTAECNSLIDSMINNSKFLNNK